MITDISVVALPFALVFSSLKKRENVFCFVFFFFFALFPFWKEEREFISKKSESTIVYGLYVLLGDTIVRRITVHAMETSSFANLSVYLKRITWSLMIGAEYSGLFQLPLFSNPSF